MSILTPRRNAILSVLLLTATPADAQPNFTAIPIDVDGGTNAKSIDSADLDGDGNVDFVASRGIAVRWYKYDGIGNFTAQDIVTGSGYATVFAADVDGDGDIDVISGNEQTDTVQWHENDGASTPTFTTHTLFTEADLVTCVFAADVDGDGDTDILSASVLDETIRWYENDGMENFTAHDLATGNDIFSGAGAIFASDVDGDGDIDVLAANRSAIQWFENDGSENFTARDINTSIVNGYSIFAADMDGDGDTDVISASFFSVPGDDPNPIFQWYENDGNTPPSFVTRVVLNSNFDPTSVYAADVDQDGDLDIVTTMSDFSNGEDETIWHENDGGSPPGFTPHIAYDVITITPWDIIVADVDNDGDVDILTAAASGLVMWLESDLVPDGACCLPTGSCAVNSEPSCQNANGTYQGDGVVCGDVSCPPAIPADFDFDGDVDLIDFQQFQQYFTGQQ